MSRLEEKFLVDYSFDTLRDVDTSSLSENDTIIYDFSAQKFTNKQFEDINIFVKRFFSNLEDINIPVNRVLQLHSPRIDGELFVDGEAYIL